MLLRADGEAVICIGQPAHAWVSGQLARAWGNERFGEVAPREEVCLGAEQHDAGMAAADRAPALNPETGRPRSFVEWPLAEKLALWRAAPDLVLPQSRYAALLTSLHGHALYAREDPATRDAAIDGFLAAEERRQEALLATLRSDPVTARWADPDVVRRNQRLVWTWDSLSLALCLEWAPFRLETVPAAGGALDLDLGPDGTLEPWPFGRPDVTLRTEGRRLEGRFPDQAALQAAWDAAPWVTLELRLRSRR